MQSFFYLCWATTNKHWGEKAGVYKENSHTPGKQEKCLFLVIICTRHAGLKTMNSVVFPIGV